VRKHLRINAPLDWKLQMTPLSVIPKLSRYFICSMFSAIALVGLLSSEAKGSSKIPWLVIPSPFSTPNFDRFGVARGCAPAFTAADIRARSFDKLDRLSVAELSSGISQLRRHFNNSARLDANAFDAAVQKINKNSHVLPTRESLMLDSLALLDQYESSVAPLFVAGASKGGISKDPVSGESAEKREARGMLQVFQTVHDKVFSPVIVASCASKLQGRRWKTADYFPGKVTAPLDVNRTFTVPVNATVPAAWGIPVAFATDAKVRPTGLYLPPGSIARVTVPPALVNAGFAIRIGAHSWDLSKKSTHIRMHRVMLRTEIVRKVTLVGSPLGGGVYIEVPYLATKGMVDIQVQGVVEAPFFSLRTSRSGSYVPMTETEWNARRTAGVPWTDFVTDYYMTQVPTNWVSAKPNVQKLLEDWDKSMQGVSEFVGIPPAKRNDVVMWSQADVAIPGDAHGIGYPQVNIIYKPTADARGNAMHPAVTNPLQNQIEFHELGHSQLFSKFKGETEALVNFPIVYVANQKFGIGLDTAFSNSFNNGGPTRNIAAVDWMVTVGFGSGLEMNRSGTVKDEFRYQARGYAKYADIAAIFGWKALTDFYDQENLNAMSPKPSDSLTSEDNRILRLSVAAKADITPLIHFWGIQPDNPIALKAAITAKGLASSPAIKAKIQFYRTLIPADAPAFLTFFNTIYPGMPAGQSPDYAEGWYHVRKTQWNAAEAQKARNVIDAILLKYYP
jgi:N-terminal domain of M60-like peptidases/Peptidase M60, enhancin and enhancin-like